jgi:pentatricopeptide repeat protein
MEEIFAEIENKPGYIDENTYSIYIKGLAKANKLTKVTEEYEKLKNNKQIKLDEAIYNQVIDCYTKTNQEEKIITVINDMREKQIKMSLLTYGLFIRLYCNKGDCNKAFDLFDECVKNDIKPSVVIYHMLIKLQIKSRFIDRAITMFRNMIVNKIKPDAVIFELVIKACLENGREKDASEFIILSLKEDIKIETFLYEMLADCFNYNFNNDVSQFDKSNICEHIISLIREKGTQVDKKIYNMLSGFIIKNEYTAPVKYNNSRPKVRNTGPHKEVSIYDAPADVVTKKPERSSINNFQTPSHNNNNNNTKKHRGSNRQPQFYGEEKSIYS